MVNNPTLLRSVYRLRSVGEVVIREPSLETAQVDGEVATRRRRSRLQGELSTDGFNYIRMLGLNAANMSDNRILYIGIYIY